MDREALARGRAFLKNTVRKQIDFSRTDQSLGRPAPPLEKPAREGAPRIDLPWPGRWNGIAGADLEVAIGRRRSQREYRREPLSLDEVAFLLWATQGLREQSGAERVYRTVPSAGCRHALETYLVLLDVAGLAPGIHRYLPLSHQLVREPDVPDLQESLVAAVMGQAFAGEAALTFIWTAIPYRMEWRYGPAAHKVIALDAGHVCQNLYLACEAIGAGACAIGAYDQEAADRLLGLDGEEEFVVYLATVGKAR